MNIAPADGTPKWNLTNNFKEEKMTVFLVLALLMGTGLIGVVIAVVKANAMVYVGITGVMSAAMWMPYLMALIYYGTDKGKPMSGLYKKLAYDPAIHKLMSTPGALPKWVKRAMVAHNNSLENFMLFATGVFFALSMQVPEADVRTPAIVKVDTKAFQIGEKKRSTPKKYQVTKEEEAEDTTNKEKGKKKKNGKGRNIWAYYY